MKVFILSISLLLFVGGCSWSIKIQDGSLKAICEGSEEPRLTHLENVVKENSMRSELRSMLPTEYWYLLEERDKSYDNLDDVVFLKC